MVPVPVPLPVPVNFEGLVLVPVPMSCFGGRCRWRCLLKKKLGALPVPVAVKIRMMPMTLDYQKMVSVPVRVFNPFSKYLLLLMFIIV